MLPQLSHDHEGGPGLLVRMRSTTTLLLSLIAAVGLGLVAFVSQQGWPNVLDGAIPNPPVELRISKGAAVGPSAQSLPSSQAANRTGKRTPASRGGAGDQTADSALSGSRQIAATPVPAPAPTATQPETTAPVPQPTAQSPANSAPASSPVTSNSESVDSQEANTSTKAKGSEKSSPGKSKGHSSLKSKDADSGKAVPAPTPVVAPPKEEPSQDEIAKAKDYGYGDEYPGKSGKKR